MGQLSVFMWIKVYYNQKNFIDDLILFGSLTNVLCSYLQFKKYILNLRTFIVQKYMLRSQKICMHTFNIKIIMMHKIQ